MSLQETTFENSIYLILANINIFSYKLRNDSQEKNQNLISNNIPANNNYKNL